MISDLQSQVISICLDAASGFGFVLAGANALQTHGISTGRRSFDADLFTDRRDPDDFRLAVSAIVSGLENAGFGVVVVQRAPLYTKLVASRAVEEVEIDLGSDWRELAPTQFLVGPVLAKDDAIGNKVAACFSRGEVRDFIDVAAIRAEAGHSDRELYDLAAHRDAGIEPDVFARQMRRVARYDLDDFAEFDLDAGSVEAIRASIEEFARSVEAFHHQ